MWANPTFKVSQYSSPILPSSPSSVPTRKTLAGLGNPGTTIQSYLESDAMSSNLHLVPINPILVRFGDKMWATRMSLG